MKCINSLVPYFHIESGQGQEAALIKLQTRMRVKVMKEFGTHSAEISHRMLAKFSTVMHQFQMIFSQCFRNKFPCWATLGATDEIGSHGRPECFDIVMILCQMIAHGRNGTETLITILSETEKQFLFMTILHVRAQIGGRGQLKGAKLAGFGRILAGV